MRKKISIGFISLALLLLFAGAISVFELSRLRRKAENIIEQNTRNNALAERMLDGLQLQNTAVIKMIISENAVPDEGYARGTAEFAAALEEAATTLRDREELEPIYRARDNFHEVIAGYANEELELDMEWFASTYLEAFYQLDGSVKDYLASPHTSISTRTSQLEENVYRTITPSILTLIVAIIIVLMFYFFVDAYYVRPLLKINAGLKKHLTTRLPFDTSFESNDDLNSLKEMVAELIEQSKKTPLN